MERGVAKYSLVPEYTEPNLGQADLGSANQ
jgi:hypothetical protein